MNLPRFKKSSYPTGFVICVSCLISKSRMISIPSSCSLSVTNTWSILLLHKCNTSPTHALRVSNRQAWKNPVFFVKLRTSLKPHHRTGENYRKVPLWRIKKSCENLRFSNEKSGFLVTFRLLPLFVYLASNPEQGSSVRSDTYSVQNQFWEGYSDEYFQKTCEMVKTLLCKYLKFHDFFRDSKKIQKI